MKDSKIKIKIIALASFFFVISRVISPRLVMAQSAVEAMAAILEIIKGFDQLDLGDISCVTLLGPNDCRSWERCDAGLGYVRALRNGLPSSAHNFEAWMAASSMRRDCGHALLGGNISRFNELYGALVANVQNCCNGNWQVADEKVVNRRVSGSGGGDIILSETGDQCIFNPWLNKYLGVHENGQLVMRPRCSGSGEKWEIQ